jgi:sugar phosphate isomerase/epimerase
MSIDDPAAVLTAAGVGGFASAHIHAGMGDLPRVPALAGIIEEFQLSQLSWLVPPQALVTGTNPARLVGEFLDLARTLTERLGVRRLVTWVEPHCDLDVLALGLASYASVALDLGLELVVEPDGQDGPTDGWRPWFEGAARRLHAAAGADTKLAFEVQDWQARNGSLDDLAACAHLIGDVHLSDALDGGRTLPLQTGRIDLSGVCATLRFAGYRGPVMAEPGRHPKRAKGAGQIRAAKAALVTLNVGE